MPHCSGMQGRLCQPFRLGCSPPSGSASPPRRAVSEWPASALPYQGQIPVRKMPRPAICCCSVRRGLGRERLSFCRSLVFPPSSSRRRRSSYAPSCRPRGGPFHQRSTCCFRRCPASRHISSPTPPARPPVPPAFSRPPSCPDCNKGKGFHRKGRWRCAPACPPARSGKRICTASLPPQSRCRIGNSSIPPICCCR